MAGLSLSLRLSLALTCSVLSAQSTLADDLLLSYPLDQLDFQPFHLRQSTDEARVHDMKSGATAEAERASTAIDLTLVVSPGHRVADTLDTGGFYASLLDAVKTLSSDSRIGLATFSEKPTLPDYTTNRSCYQQLMPLTPVQELSELATETGNDVDASALIHFSLLELMSHHIDNKTQSIAPQGNQLGALVDSLLSRNTSLSSQSATSVVLMVTDQAFHWAGDGAASAFRPAIFGTAFSDRQPSARCNQYDYPSPLHVRQLLRSKWTYLTCLSIRGVEQTATQDTNETPEASWHWLTSYLSQPSDFVQSVTQGQPLDPPVQAIFNSLTTWITKKETRSDENFKTGHEDIGVNYEDVEELSLRKSVSEHPGSSFTSMSIITVTQRSSSSLSLPVHSIKLETKQSHVDTLVPLSSDMTKSSTYHSIFEVRSLDSDPQHMTASADTGGQEPASATTVIIRQT